jgi:hypothetical protein
MTERIASKCFAAILGLTVACSGVADSAGISPPQTDISTVVRYLKPALDGGTSVRFSYAASCLATSDFPPIPAIRLRAPSSRFTGIDAVRSVFESDRHVTVTKGPDGIANISVGKVPTNVLETHVALLKPQPIEQYNPSKVIEALESTKELEGAVKSSDLLLVRALDVQLLYQPGPKDRAPHVPAVLHNISIDQVLNMVAVTFGGVVTYGVCTAGPAPRQLSIDCIFLRNDS